MNSQQKSLALVIVVFLAACQRPSAAPAPEPVPTIEPSPDPSRPLDPNSRTRWTFTPVSQPQRYRSITNAALEMAGATLTRDSITSILDYQLAVTGTAGSLSFSGVIESAEFRGARVSNNTLSFPIPFSGRIENGAATVLVANSQIDCSSGSQAVVPSIQRAVIAVPGQIYQGMTWTDSTVSPVCSGSVPGTLRAIRTYLVTGEGTRGGRNSILLERKEKTILEAEGAEGQHRLRIRGSGSGQSEIRLDPSTGSLIEITGSHTTTLSVTASGREQLIVQVSREQVTTR